MPTPDQTESKPNAEPSPDVHLLAQAIGLVVSNEMKHVWLSESDRSQAVDNAYEQLCKAFENAPDVSFRVLNGALHVNDDPVDSSHHLVATFNDRLLQLDVPSFSLSKGLTRETFSELLDVFCTAPDDLQTLGGFARAVTTLELPNIHVKKIAYREIDDSEIVVSKDLLKKVTGSEQIVAFLTGGEAPDDATLEAIRTVSNDSRKLSELLLHSAAADTADGPKDGPYTARLAQGIHQTFRALATNEAMRTQKGRRELTRTMKVLGADLIEGLSDDEHGDHEATTAVQDAIERVTGQLKLEDLASEYVRKRAALEQNERRLQRFLRSVKAPPDADQHLRSKFLDQGLSTGAWVRMAESTGPESVTDGADTQASLHIADRLDHLLRTVQTTVKAETEEGTVPDPGKVEKILSELDESVGKLVRTTEQRISALVDGIREETERDKHKTGPRKSSPRRQRILAQTLELLAEIVQEFCQPLAVIDCSISMLLRSGAGTMKEDHAGMLELAAKSAGRLQLLVDRLKDISGLPSSLSPDEEIVAGLRPEDKTVK